jgi:hypothetical protein
MTMELLDRYLKAIKVLLPQGQQDDILKELSDDILSQMEEREAELGRPLTEAEQELILQRHGRPMQVAGRYQTSQRSVAFGRQLIGPVLFPLYIKILSLNLAITLIVCVGAAIAFAGRQPILQTVPAFLSHFVLQFAIITGIFALAENSSTRFLDNWNPRSLLAKAPAVKDERRIPRSQSIAELIVLGLFLSWWVAAPYYPRTIFGGSDATLSFGPGSQLVFRALLPLMLLGVIRSCVVLVRPRWARFYWVTRLVATSASLVVLGLSLQVGRWIVLAGPGSAPYLANVERLNHWAGLCVIALVAGCCVEWALELRRLVRLGRSGPGLEKPLQSQQRQA